MPSQANASRDFILFEYVVNLPRGRGATMSDLMDAIDVDDPQIVRTSLVRLRKGIPDPQQRGHRLRRLQIWWNPQDKRYYDLGNLSGDAIEGHVPAGILNAAVEQLMTRVTSLDNAVGEDGVLRDAEELLDDEGWRRLIEQLPLTRIWQIHNAVLQIAQARQLLEIQAAREGHALPPGGGSDGGS